MGALTALSRGRQRVSEELQSRCQISGFPGTEDQTWRPVKGPQSLLEGHTDTLQVLQQIFSAHALLAYAAPLKAVSAVCPHLPELVLFIGEGVEGLGQLLQSVLEPVGDV